MIIKKLLAVFIFLSIFIAPLTVNAAEGDVVFGTRGTQVTMLQQTLNKLGYVQSKYITGYYGAITKNAVLRFQKDQHLKQTGYGDRDTRERLVVEFKKAYPAPVVATGGQQATQSLVTPSTPPTPLVPAPVVPVAPIAPVATTVATPTPPVVVDYTNLPTISTISTIDFSVGTEVTLSGSNIGSGTKKLSFQGTGYGDIVDVTAIGGTIRWTVPASFITFKTQQYKLSIKDPVTGFETNAITVNFSGGVSSNSYNRGY